MDTMTISMVTTGMREPNARICDPEAVYPRLSRFINEGRVKLFGIDKNITGTMC